MQFPPYLTELPLYDNFFLPKNNNLKGKFEDLEEFKNPTMRHHINKEASEVLRLIKNLLE